MADKKITDLDEVVTSVDGNDLVLLVGNTSTTPMNYKVRVRNFLANLNLETYGSGLKINVQVSGAVTGDLAAGTFILGYANSAVNAQSTWATCAVNRTANTQVAPRAFWATRDEVGAGGLNTLLLFDVGASGNVVTQDLANAANAVPILHVNANNTVTHKIKGCINGMNVWLLVSNTAQ